MKNSVNRRKFIALIPARKGSVGIKNKNLVSINNKKLIEYTFEAVKKSKLINECYVSSNDKIILKVAKKYKKFKIILRKNSLSNSSTLMKDVVLNAIMYFSKQEKLENINIVLLQPTSPLRTSTDIDKAIKCFANAKTKQSLISTSAPVTHPNDIVYKKNSKTFFLLKNAKQTNRQNFNKFFFINGSIFIFNAEYFLKKKKFVDNNTIFFKMKKKHSFELDDHLDLKIIKALKK
jgi:CMP-N-acetylneuraminic acid synthetase